MNNNYSLWIISKSCKALRPLSNYLKYIIALFSGTLYLSNVFTCYSKSPSLQNYSTRKPVSSTSKYSINLTTLSLSTLAKYYYSL